MEADRQQVMTAALVADTKQMDAIARQESHLSRELARALAALEQVMRLRCDPADPLVFDLSRRRVTAEVRVGLPAIDAGVAG
jgi:hypothetical protein